LAFVLLFAFSFSAASATEFFGPAPLQPQLSSDGKTLYNAIPVVVYMADPNPPAGQVNIPPPFNLRTLPEKATATFSITYVPMAAQTLLVIIVPLSRLARQPLLMPLRPFGATCCSLLCR